MDNEKIENLLNLSLNSTLNERERSSVLDVGYVQQENSWEVVIKFSGNLDDLRQKFPQIEAKELLYQYALLTIPESLIDEVASDVQVAYMEKPKRLFFAGTEQKIAGAETYTYREKRNVERKENRKKQNMPVHTLADVTIQQNVAGLTGKGVIIAVIDSGIDYAHPDFRNADGTTRILKLWDQTLGQIYDSEQINEALQAPTEQQRYALLPSRDLSGHGTHVAGIAAGNGRGSDGRYTGVAPESSLMIVKLGTPRENSFPRTTELMSAVDYVLRQAEEYQMPIVVNLSFGNNYGGHDGTALLETYLDEVSSYWKSVIITGTGNEGASRIHTSGRLAQNLSPTYTPNQQIPSQEVAFSVGAYETGFSLQIWKSYADEIRISLKHPSGVEVGNIRSEIGTQRIVLEGTEVLVYYGMPSPYSVSQEIFLDFIPTASYVDMGTWTVILVPGRIVEGTYDMWLPGQSILSEGTGFLYPTEETTLTIPSTSSKVISVAAYDARYLRLAEFSGRGFTRNRTQIKPDVAAPGVDIISAVPGGGYGSRSGTSMAAPFVSGKEALLMEDGIVNRNDPFLYGEKIKAFFHREARQLGIRTEYPNPELGWGILS